CLFSCDFLSAFLVVIAARAVYFAIDHSIDRENLHAVACGVFRLDKTNFLASLLTPLDKAAFEIGFGLLQQLDVYVGLDDTVNQKVFYKRVALIEVNSANQCLKGIAQE